MKLRLHHRYSLVIVTLLLSAVALIAGTAVVTFANLSSRTESASVQAMADALRHQAISDGQDLIRLVGQIVANSLNNSDLRDMNDDLRVIHEYKGILSIRVTDMGGKLLHDAGKLPPGTVLRGREAIVRDVLEKRIASSAIVGDILSIAAPVMLDDRLLGAVYADISLTDLLANVTELQRNVAEIAADGRSSLIVSVGLAALALGVIGLLVGVLVARSLSHPIKQLSAATRRIGREKYDFEVPSERSDEIGDLARDLRKMATDLQKAGRMSRLATVGEVAVGVAHELNQPLNTIRMASDNALAALDDAEPDTGYLRKKLDLVSLLAGRMGEQIQRMCAVGRRDERQVLFDPAPPIRDALALHSGGLETEGIELTVAWPPAAAGGWAISVLGLPNQLMQVLVNLIANARDAIVERGDMPLARVKALRGRIAVSVEVEEIARELRVVVADNGGGIPPEIIARVFDPFFTTKEVNKGTGLGLSISYGIVAGMGGHITVHNGPEGAVFTVVVPLASGSAVRAAE